VRQAIFDVPVPDGAMRCRCFAHAQAFRKAGRPVRMVPEARVDHELPPFFSERYRQGYDTVVAALVNRDLKEAAWLRLGVLAAPLFYARTVRFDWRRLVQGRRDLDLSWWQVALGLPLLPLCRLVDLLGILSALLGKRERYDPPAPEKAP